MANNASIESNVTELLTTILGEIEADKKEVDVRQKRIEANNKLALALRLRIAAMNPESKASGYGSKVETISKAIKNLPNPRFTQDDVEAELERSNPEMERDRNRIRAAIWTICKKHKAIKLISKGSNRSPAQFERTDRSSPPPRRTIASIANGSE